MRKHGGKRGGGDSGISVTTSSLTNVSDVTLSAESSLILGENKAAFRREGHIYWGRGDKVVICI